MRFNLASRFVSCPVLLLTLPSDLRRRLLKQWPFYYGELSHKSMIQAVDASIKVARQSTDYSQVSVSLTHAQTRQKNS